VVRQLGDGCSETGSRACWRAARRGDETAWTRLYLDLAPTLTGYLRGRGCPTPEDVTSETLLQVVRDLCRFDGDERPSGPGCSPSPTTG
jgi:DNA-directed RNA polymerase specialized sigma24 family protein